MNESGVSCSTLDCAAIGETLAVVRVEAPARLPEWGRWLEEIGFVAGEQVRLMAKAIPGGDPMVVRVGQSTFALRRAEAACIGVVPAGALAGSPVDRTLAEGVSV
ncbi:MAG: ferrous iron transport protein A [Candidatus Accumulibacter sp.]|jgi:ferrous iron transport protein A|nr:ferrous iron transport protein A [Accumulibacter sp.]